MQHTAEIPIPVDLQELFKIPVCADLALPKAEKLQLRLPTGATITAIPDLTKGIPSDCSLVANIFLQLAPFLASIECLLKVLGLIKPLIDVVNSLGPPPDPIKLPKAIVDFGVAAGKLAECLKIIIPGLGIYNFVKDLLLLIIKIIKCLIDQLESILAIMQGIELRLGDAEAAGNTELKRVLECAKANATTAADHASQSLGPVTNILPLVQVFLEMAGVKLEIPSIGSAQDSAALQATIDKLKDTITTIEAVIETLP
jgi:hypothetical protein